jgi:hypothetical protein
MEFAGVIKMPDPIHAPMAIIVSPKRDISFFNSAMHKLYKDFAIIFKGSFVNTPWKR